MTDVATKSSQTAVQPIKWEDDILWLLDQRLLPRKLEYIPIKRCSEAVAAIRDMVVRGAPAIGITAAYAVVLSAREAIGDDPNNWQQRVEPDLIELGQARPTAVNLAWAIATMRRTMVEAPMHDPVPALLAKARELHAQDLAANRAMGRAGAALINRGSNVLTHCNAGALATAGYGTALGVVRAGIAEGRIVQVYADETRPWLQGARLTAWELLQEGIPVTLIPEAAAAHLMRAKKINWVVVGADRIAANGDIANKIGTYSLAVNARAHGIKFMVVAPINTIDPETASGDDIPIEERGAEEVLSFAGVPVAAEGATAVNPVFDVTPAELVDFLVTEFGVVERPDKEKIRGLLASARSRVS